MGDRADLACFAPMRTHAMKWHSARSMPRVNVFLRAAMNGCSPQRHGAWSEMKIFLSQPTNSYPTRSCSTRRTRGYTKEIKNFKAVSR